MIGNIIETCARNRVAVFLGVAVAAVAAWWSIQRVELDAIPDLNDPQVIIYSEWMGRSPTLVEDQVTYPIVSGLVAAPQVTDVRGYSMFGMSFVYVLFEEGTDLYWARSRVLEYMSGITARLPAGVTPQLGPDATGIGWVVQYTLVDKRSGDSAARLDELRTLQDFTLRYALGSVPGVAEVASVGGYQKQYQVTVDPERMRAHGVTIHEVLAAVRDSSGDVGGRVIEMSGREYYVRGRGYVDDIADVDNVVVRAHGPAGVPVLVRDVATVQLGPEIRRGLLEWNGEGEAVGGIVVMRHGENALDVAERVKAKLAELEPSLPAGVDIEIAYDRSDVIVRSIDTLKHALLEEGLAVALVIILFLLHLRSALLPILSLPLAVGLAFIPMYLLDIPATIMSLGGIGIALGAAVDAEIVMIEAAHKALEHAPKSLSAQERRRLLAGAALEVTPAIFFSLLIIAVAFLPVFALNGQAGRLFHPLAATKTFVMLAAAILSITFAPALRDLVVRGKIRPESKHPISRVIVSVYKPFVYVALRKPKSTIAIGLLAVLSAIPLVPKLGHEFMPPLDEGDILYMPTTFPNISIEEAKHQLQRQDQLLRSFPEVISVAGKVGRAETATDPAPLTMVETVVRLKPRTEWRTVREDRWHSSWAPDWLSSALGVFWPEERPLTMEELTEEMNHKLDIPGWTNAWTMPIKARIDMQTTGIRTPIGIKVFGTDLDEIEDVGTRLEELLRYVPGTRSVLYERSQGGLYIDIVPRREALARYGLTVGDVGRLIEAAIGGATVTSTVEGRARFTINVRYPQDIRSDVEALRELLVPLPAAPGSGGGAGMGDGMKQGSIVPRGSQGVLYAQMDMGGGSGGMRGSAGDRPRLPVPSVMTDTGSMSGMGSSGSMAPGAGMGNTMSDSMAAPGGMGSSTRPAGGPMGVGGVATEVAYVPLGQIAEIAVVSGPPMVRNENGLLVGYVYVDIDQGSRDVGGYVADAKAAVAKAIEVGELSLPHGTYLEWSGQYEQMAQMAERMKIVIPLTLLVVVVLLFLQFRNVIEVLIVLLSIPFALVGSVWLLWLLEYRISTAVWVGVIALVGLAAQTGIVMIVYIDNAFERRRKAGMIRNLDDIIWAHMEGTVNRVRPKLMTVITMLVSLLPLLWADGTGADVMKRIAAPMVGGLLSSTFLTLEIIPVIYTYWRLEQLLHERLAELWPERRRQLRELGTLVGAGAALATAVLVAGIYVDVPAFIRTVVLALSGFTMLVALIGYLSLRPAARRKVWPPLPRATSSVAA